MWMFNKRIDTQLRASALAMLGAVIVMAVIALRLSSDFASTIKATGARQMLAGKIAAGTAEIGESMRGVVMSAMLQDEQEMRKQQRQMRAADSAVGEAIQTLKAMSAGTQAEATLAEFQRDHQPMKGNIDRVEQMIQSQQVDRAMSLFNETMRPAIQRLADNAKRLVAAESEQFDQTVAAAAARTDRGRLIAWGVLLIACLVGAAVFWVVNSITGRLRNIAGDLSECSGQVTLTASQVATTSQTLMRDTSNQATALQQTSSSTEEISALTQQNAERAKSVADMVRETEHAVADGNHALGDMETAMQAIRTSSDKISRIIKVIDEIAFQTNILALNAAVEAARAGEAGMGFAVVADEVRSLAQRSAQAARDTTDLIEESIGRAAAGSAKLQRVTESIVAITGYATKVKTLAEEVSSGSQEQARGITEIARTLREVEQVTHRGTAAANDTSGASREMGNQAEALQEMVEQLAFMVGGLHTEAPHAHPVRARSAA